VQKVTEELSSVVFYKNQVHKAKNICTKEQKFFNHTIFEANINILNAKAATNLILSATV